MRSRLAHLSGQVQHVAHIGGSHGYLMPIVSGETGKWVQPRIIFEQIKQSQSEPELNDGDDQDVEMKIATGKGDRRNQQAVWGPRGCQVVDSRQLGSCFPKDVKVIDPLTPPVMAFTAPSSWLAATLALFSFLSLLLPANALYFYVDGRQTKCFYEDLPKDTLVAGMISPPLIILSTSQQAIASFSVTLTNITSTFRQLRYLCRQPPNQRLLH